MKIIKLGYIKLKRFYTEKQTNKQTNKKTHKQKQKINQMSKLNSEKASYEMKESNCKQS